MQKGAIFDMDGTLIDTERIYQKGWFSVAPEFGEKSSMELARAVSGTSGEQMRQVVNRFYPKVDPELYVQRVIEFVKEETVKHIDLMPGVTDILKFFAENGVKMAVASSSPTEVIKTNLGQVGIIDYFDALIGGDQIKCGKPAPDIFLKAAASINLSPGDCYVFEDSLNGVRAAHAAKCTAVMIPDQVPPTDEIRKIADAIIPSLVDALAAVKRGEL